MKKVIADVGAHYDLLIEENNDPVRDPVVLQEYMDLWDGRLFLEMLELNPSKSVLEIGVGTGRLAVRTAPCCRHLTGIDMSAKTIERAQENLREYPNISLICNDFLTHSFSETFDVIYSSLTMMHFPDKALVIGKMSSLLNDDGILCISIDKNQSEWIDMGNRKVRIYPDTPEEIVTIAGQAGLKTKRVLEIENAYLLAFCKVTRGSNMEKVEINSYEDLFNVLDRINESIDWNTFYEKRVMKAPFLVNNMLPDKMITEFVQGHSIRDAVEFGCGEGRNAIFLAKRGIDVTAIDSSDIAIRNAKEKTEDLKNVKLICSDFLAVDFAGRKYDLVLDSGMFHHLAPHRRLQYRELLKGLLKENGYFLLLCFSADEDGAEELDDLEFYTKRNTGVAFSEQRLRDFFGSDFEIISIEKRGQEITEEYIDIPLLYGCVMKLK